MRKQNGVEYSIESAAETIVGMQRAFFINTRRESLVFFTAHP